MPIGTPYATLTELKDRLQSGGIADTNDDALFNAALASASQAVEDYCRRQFNDAGSATARTYRPATSTLVRVDDFHTTVGLVVKSDDGDDGVFETTIASTSYELEPRGGIVQGRTGWPYRRIRLVDSSVFPCGRRASVEVTARWGWAAIPAPVEEATLIMAEELARLKDAPFGVAGFADFGIIRVRDNPFAARLLNPYRRDSVLVA